RTVHGSTMSTTKRYGCHFHPQKLDEEGLKIARKTGYMVMVDERDYMALVELMREVKRLLRDAKPDERPREPEEFSAYLTQCDANFDYAMGMIERTLESIG